MIYILTILFCISEAHRDKLRIDQGTDINHITGFIYRFLFFIPIYFVAGMEALTCFQAFYLVFDPLLNKLRGKHFFYLGKGSFWDRIFGLNPQLFFTIELILCIISVYLFAF